MTALSSTKSSEGGVSRRSCVAAVAIALFLAHDSRGQTEGPFESQGRPPQEIVLHQIDSESRVEVIWKAPESGRSYLIESSTDLRVWQPYLGEVTTVDGLLSLTVPVEGVPSRFFRLRYLQSPAISVRDTFDQSGNGALEFPEILQAMSMAGPPVLPFLVELELQGLAEGALELEQAFHSIPEDFLVEVFDSGFGNLELAALWNMLGAEAQDAISSAATSFPQPHGLMLQLIVQRMGELAYLNLPESPLARQGLEDFLGNYFGTDPLADRAAIRALVRSTAPPSVPQVHNLFADLLDLVETPTSIYVVPFDPNLDRELEIELTEQDLLNALTLPWLPPLPCPPELNPFEVDPGLEIGCWPEIWKWGWMEPWRQGLI